VVRQSPVTIFKNSPETTKVEQRGWNHVRLQNSPPKTRQEEEQPNVLIIGRSSNSVTQNPSLSTVQYRNHFEYKLFSRNAEFREASNVISKETSLNPLPKPSGKPVEEKTYEEALNQIVSSTQFVSTPTSPSGGSIGQLEGKKLAIKSIPTQFRNEDIKVITSMTPRAIVGPAPPPFVSSEKPLLPTLKLTSLDESLIEPSPEASSFRRANLSNRKQLDLRAKKLKLLK